MSSTRHADDALKQVLKMEMLHSPARVMQLLLDATTELQDEEPEFQAVWDDAVRDLAILRTAALEEWGQ